MYVTYETNQYYIDEESFTIQRHSGPPKLISFTTPKPEGEDCMPAKLVRVSDMQVVDGASINEGYCALSYSWSWCGENNIVNNVTGKSLRVDKGKHKIIFPDKVKEVKFEGVIQQLCKDFNIKYIWFDQMCIDQNNKKEKYREMKRMHVIYSHAHCTIALVPELQTEIWTQGGETHRGMGSVNLMHSDWMRRIWTLEEGLMSSNLLFVGQDTYMWWHTAVQWTALGDLVSKPSLWNVSTVLYYAHTRRTTKEHDRVFAIANLFPELMDQITVGYDQPILDFLIKFYGILARHDLSILYFGRDEDYKRIVERSSFNTSPSADNQQQEQQQQNGSLIPIRNYDLPSWTGVEGEHDLNHFSGGLWKTSFKNYSVDGRSMKIHCSSYIPSMNHVNKNNSFISLQHEDLPPLPSALLDSDGNDTTKSDRIVFTLAIEVQLPGCDEPKKIPLLAFDFIKTNGKLVQRHNEDTMRIISRKELNWLSLFMPISKDHLFWYKDNAQVSDYTRMEFSITENADPSAQYAILTEVAFEHSLGNIKHKAYPVVRTNGDYYKSIGVCTITRPEYFFAGYEKEVPEKTFVIQ
ncbi:hypothetical protein BDA99DRAFT_563969 [Phascolomyces articulosus]|uniref:Heterokaryon incompatibility domain-containing protein n=1 Tax=Phascolomyces articulosus TaxID=60185 RepID=A0AAD5P9D8_9FUNG|nr:hypothetical protein BDA99DRAFT_563969 [Phascolomyces articulosus]